MSKQTTLSRQGRRQHRTRVKISGTAEKPRLTVRISHLHVSAQLIDDNSAKTLAYASTIGQKNVSKSLTAKASLVGEQIANKAKTIKISSVVFDRGSKLYHGRVKALADAARKNGLEF